MKNFNLLSLVVAATLVFSSCSTNENLDLDNPSSELLKSYTIKRDATGAYSLDYSLNGNTQVDNVKDVKTKTNQIFLYSSDNLSSKKVTQDLTIDGEELKIGFIDTQSDKNPNITIIDDNISLSRNENKKLEEYSITSNGDGTYNLEFNVKNNVRVDFVYNDEIKTYEIHLEEGNGNQTNYSRLLNKIDDEPLKFDFVNHIYNSSSRALAQVVRKPRSIIRD